MSKDWENAPRAVEYHFTGCGYDIVVERPEPFNGPGGFGYEGWTISLNGAEPVPCTSVQRFRDGGTTIMETAIGTLFSPARMGRNKEAAATWTPKAPAGVPVTSMPVERQHVAVSKEVHAKAVTQTIEHALRARGWTVDSSIVAAHLPGVRWGVTDEDGNVQYVETW